MPALEKLELRIGDLVRITEPFIASFSGILISKSVYEIQSVRITDGYVEYKVHSDWWPANQVITDLKQIKELIEVQNACS